MASGRLACGQGAPGAASRLRDWPGRRLPRGPRDPEEGGLIHTRPAGFRRARCDGDGPRRVGHGRRASTVHVARRRRCNSRHAREACVPNAAGERRGYTDSPLVAGRSKAAVACTSARRTTCAAASPATTATQDPASRQACGSTLEGLLVLAQVQVFLTQQAFSRVPARFQLTHRERSESDAPTRGSSQHRARRRWWRSV